MTSALTNKSKLAILLRRTAAARVPTGALYVELTIYGEPKRLRVELEQSYHLICWDFQYLSRLKTFASLLILKGQTLFK